MVGLFGIALVSTNTEDANPIPVPGELLWIDQIFNGHGWTDRGQIDGLFLKSPDGRISGYYTPEAQMGAFNAAYTRSGGVVDLNVTNPITLNSQALHMTARLGISDPASGPFGTVHQKFISLPMTGATRGESERTSAHEDENPLSARQNRAPGRAGDVPFHERLHDG